MNIKTKLTIIIILLLTVSVLGAIFSQDEKIDPLQLHIPKDALALTRSTEIRLGEFSYLVPEKCEKKSGGGPFCCECTYYVYESPGKVIPVTIAQQCGSKVFVKESACSSASFTCGKGQSCPIFEHSDEIGITDPAICNPKRDINAYYRQISGHCGSSC